MKVLFLAKDHTDLGHLESYLDAGDDLTVVSCFDAHLEFFRYKGYNVIDSKKFFDLDMKFDVIIGNPPYGPGGNLAINFLNRAGELSDDVRLILPISVRKSSSLNKIRLDMICVQDDKLPDDTFPRSIKTVYQRWVKADTPRKKIEIITVHPDFEFVPYDQRHEANVFIGIKGGGPAGRVKTENFHHYADTGHHLIKCNKEVQERLVSLEPQFREEALITQIPSLGKNDLISIYIKNYP
jgi:hypothetical protein